jgi:hypothetical protein
MWQSFIPAGLSMAGSLFGAFGKEKRGYQPETQNRYSGYYGLPPEAQHLWQEQFRRMGGAQQYDPNLMQQYGQPNDMFGSQELANLQQRTPGRGVYQVGVTEPLHAFEKQALGAYGKPDYSQAGLAPYEMAYDPMRKALTGQINDESERLRTQQAGMFGANDPRGLNMGSSPERIADMLAQQEREKRLDQMNMDIRNSALGLRESTLANMLGAGGQIREQNQQLLQNASGQGMAQNSPQNQFMQYMLAMLQGLPQSEYSNMRGATPAVPGWAQKLGAGMQGTADMMGKSKDFGGGR